MPLTLVEANTSSLLGGLAAHQASLPPEEQALLPGSW